ncbi:hypothetical protein BC828DRAFT_440020 [Blastocladiella britannica]|nr:hypothetical protein BC828DRAFT_440020 [Blastocladiella britannica]
MDVDGGNGGGGGGSGGGGANGNVLHVWAPGTPERDRADDYVGQGRTEQPKCRSGVLTYEANDRSKEAGHKRNAAELDKQMAEHLGQTEADVKALQSSLGAEGRPVRSCFAESFRDYLLQLQLVLPRLRVFYGTVSHRRHRMRSLVQSKGSIAKFAQRIKTTFAPAATDKPIALAFGDWTYRQGLRAGRSTPSIGLRRALALEFVLVLVDELRTSRLCPTCKGRVMHPITRITTWPLPAPDPNNPAGDGVREYRSPVHHLLRCPSVHCNSQWWNRDALGVVNIAAKARRVLLRLPPHQAYRR